MFLILSSISPPIWSFLILELFELLDSDESDVRFFVALVKGVSLLFDVVESESELFLFIISNILVFKSLSLPPIWGGGDTLGLFSNWVASLFGSSNPFLINFWIFFYW